MSRNRTLTIVLAAGVAVAFLVAAGVFVVGAKGAAPKPAPAPSIAIVAENVAPTYNTSATYFKFDNQTIFETCLPEQLNTGVCLKLVAPGKVAAMAHAGDVPIMVSVNRKYGALVEVVADGKLVTNRKVIDRPPYEAGYFTFSDLRTISTATEAIIRIDNRMTYRLNKNALATIADFCDLRDRGTPLPVTDFAYPK